MNGLILPSCPYPRHQVRHDAHIPPVGVVLRGTRLATHLVGELVGPTESQSCTCVYNPLEKSGHEIGIILADHLVDEGGEGGDHIAVAVFDACHIERTGMYTLVCKGTVRCHHLLEREVGGAQEY